MSDYGPTDYGLLLLSVLINAGVGICTSNPLNDITEPANRVVPMHHGGPFHDLSCKHYIVILTYYSFSRSCYYYIYRELLLSTKRGNSKLWTTLPNL